MERLTKETVEQLNVEELSKLLSIVNYNQELVLEKYQSYFKTLICYFSGGNSEITNLSQYLQENYKKKLHIKWIGHQGFIGSTQIQVLKEDYDVVKKLITDKYSSVEDVFNPY